MPLPDEPNESDTEYDGFLSYSAEWHALAIGTYDGMKDWRVRPGKIPDNPDVQAEPHYYKGGYVVGTLVQTAIVAATAWVGAGLF